MNNNLQEKHHPTNQSARQRYLRIQEEQRIEKLSNEEIASELIEARFRLSTMNIFDPTAANISRTYFALMRILEARRYN